MIVSLETIFTFSLAAALLSLSPGPSNLYIMARTFSCGHLSGVAAASGMALGSLAYVAATALGLAVVFKYSPDAFTALKLVGAGYLIYLAYKTFRQASPSKMTEQKVKVVSVTKVFKQSIVVELTNPKTALFFLAFLPQFVDHQQGSVALQLTILGCIYAVIAFCSDLFVVALSNQLGKWIAGHPMFVEWQDRLSASILLGLGCFIGIDELTSKWS
ncbi:LysE family translocator [Aliiglaciecola sp. LCG003]|uniref:LysE family translocator n=1 Tax=Aliiglaciecola sp. LCG003 TaxID=3053655 RepID=UPI002574781D|nr:LysE family translocator [Aliiglaciecola sp. LCG003]WJG09818.1 LysE family translocator [Aliiglaciecola sp. LCG003]